jgi:hypothetical protein
MSDLAAAMARFLVVLIVAVLRQIFPGLFPAPPDASIAADDPLPQLPEGARPQHISSSETTRDTAAESECFDPHSEVRDDDDRPTHNPEIRRMISVALTALSAIGASVAAAELGSPVSPTQYWLGISAGALVVLEIADGGEGGSTGKRPPSALSQRGLILRCLTLAAISVTAFIFHPSLFLVCPDCLMFWLFTLSMWKCTSWSIPTAGTFWGAISRSIIVLKRMFGGRRGARVAFAFGLLAFTAVTATTSASVSIVAAIKHAESRASDPNNKKANHSTKIKTSTTATSSATKTSGTTQAPPSSPFPEWDGACGTYQYRNVPGWEAHEITELLGGSAGLGRNEEGCVEQLHNEYAASSAFVWGEGVNPISGAPLSIVLDSRTLAPAIVLTPALKAVRGLIHHYKLLGGSETLFPRYRAGSGDYYLLETAEHETCIVIRSKSGSIAEAPPYTTLYPSTAIAWLKMVELTGKWQWPVESVERNKQNEIVYELFTPGSTTKDAEITYNTKSEEAKWDGYPYPAHQNRIPHATVQQYVDRDLEH